MLEAVDTPIFEKSAGESEAGILKEKKMQMLRGSFAFDSSFPFFF